MFSWQSYLVLEQHPQHIEVPVLYSQVYGAQAEPLRLGLDVRPVDPAHPVLAHTVLVWINFFFFVVFNLLPFSRRTCKFEI